MKDQQLNSSQIPHFLSKTSSTRSCQNLFCFSKKCRQDEVKEKQRVLNSNYFQKLSLKKFNNNSTLINHSLYEKGKAYQKSLKRDRSTQQNEFQNIVINPQVESLTKQNLKNNQYQTNEFNSQIDQSQRIVRSSSHRIFNYPQPKTDRSVSRQLSMEYNKRQELQELKKDLENQIKQLDQSIDKYYNIYHSKLDQLKQIQFQISQISGKKRELQKTPSNDDLKSFKKKNLLLGLEPNKFLPNQKNQVQPDPHVNGRSKKNQSFFSPSNLISFVKKNF